VNYSCQSRPERREDAPRASAIVGRRQARLPAAEMRPADVLHTVEGGTPLTGALGSHRHDLVASRSLYAGTGANAKEQSRIYIGSYMMRGQSVN
jgi:hypothetical protein